MEQTQQPAQAVQAFGYQGKSRNVLAGFNFFGEALPFVNFIMFLLGWFTVPVEVLFRKNFGQRWLTGINFYAGLMVLTTFTVLQAIGSALSSNNSSFSYQRQQAPPPEPSFLDSIMNNTMPLILLAYILVSSYHFFKMWWGNRTNSALHSFDDGTSRFEPVAVYLMRLVNIIAVPVIRLYMLLLPKEERRYIQEIPPLTNDVTAFTNTVVEPLVLFILFLIFKGTTATWLLISAAALAIYSNWKEAAKLDKALDFRDAVIDAQVMMAVRDRPRKQQALNTQNLIMLQVADTVEKQPEIAEKVKPLYPDLMDIIEDMNSEKNNLAKSY